MALENSSFKVLPLDYFDKPKTLASNASAIPKPLNAVIPNSPSTMSSLAKTSSQQPVIRPNAPVDYSNGNSKAPIINQITGLPEYQKTSPATTSSVSTLNQPVVAPPPIDYSRGAYGAAFQSDVNKRTQDAAQQLQDQQKKSLEDQQKKIDDLTKNIKEKFAAPAPALPKSTQTATPGIVAPAPKTIGSQDVMAPIDELYNLQQNVLNQQKVADTQFKKDQLSQQLAEMDQQGGGVANAFYRTLMRDQDANYATSQRAITENYLNKKASVLAGERSIEQARIDDAKDKNFQILMSIPDSKTAFEFAKGLSEAFPDDPMFSSLANNTAYWKAREVESDAKFQEQSKFWSQQALAIATDPLKTESEKKAGFIDALTKSMADPNLQARSWAGSDTARQDLIDTYGPEAGAKIYEDLLNTGDAGAKEAFFDVRYKKAVKQAENDSLIGKMKSTLPPADTKAEEVLNQKFIELAAKGALAGVIQIDVDGSGNLKNYSYSLEKYGIPGTLESLTPEQVPGLDILVKDWNGNDYKGDYTPSQDPEDWMNQLDTAYQNYLSGYDKTTDGPLLNRNQFKDAMTEKDDSGNVVSVKDGNVKDIIKQTSSVKTPSQLLEDLNFGRIKPNELTNEEFKKISYDPTLLNTITQTQVKLPIDTIDIQKSNQNFSYQNLNPPVLTYENIDGKITPYKLTKVIRRDQFSNDLIKTRLVYVYEDANGQRKEYSTSFIPTNFNKNVTKNGIKIEYQNRAIK